MKSMASSLLSLEDFPGGNAFFVLVSAFSVSRLICPRCRAEM